MHAYLHSIDEHTSQTEWNLFRELLPGHGYFKTVSKVNVRDLPTHTVQHQVGRMSAGKIHVHKHVTVKVLQVTKYSHINLVIYEIGHG